MFTFKVKASTHTTHILTTSLTPCRKFLINMQQMSDLIMWISQWIRRNKVQELSPVHIVMDIDRTGGDTLRNSCKVMCGMTAAMSGFGIGPLAV